MEEKLNELIKLKELQDRVITLRTEVPSMYGKFLKKECNISIKSLLSGDVCVEQHILQNPQHHVFECGHIKIFPSVSLNEVSQLCNNTLECLSYLRK